MNLIPLNTDDSNIASFLDSISKFPLSFVCIDNPGDYENECIVFRVEEDIDSLYGFILLYSIEDTETDLPDYSQTQFLTFDDTELQKGSILKIFTRKGEDTSFIEFKTAALNLSLYWGLPHPIWHIPHSSYELVKRRDSISGGLMTL